MVDDTFLFAEDAEPSVIKKPWKVLIVDDDHGVHDVTKLALKNLIVHDRPLSFTSVYSAKEAMELLEHDSTFAVALIDVVMETTHAGLELMDYVAELNKERSNQGLPIYKLSVGIATGLVRGHEKQDAEDTPYPFMRDVVRTAQRLQQFTVSLDSGGVLISEETYNFIKTVLHQFSFGRQGPVKFPWETTGCTGSPHP